MNTENIPQVGSKWQFGTRECEVEAVKKRGRGYQVEISEQVVPDFAPNLRSVRPVRLRDFLKAAKPL